jgi:hypothetical protein
MQMGNQIQVTSLVVCLLLIPLITTSCKHEKYDSILDARDWKNPFLIVQGNGVTVISQDERVVVPVDKLHTSRACLQDAKSLQVSRDCVSFIKSLSSQVVATRAAT